MILEVDDVTAGYGPITVLRDVSMQVEPGEILGVLGRNGMGKIDADPLPLRSDPPDCRPHHLRRARRHRACRRTSGRGSA